MPEPVALRRLPPIRPVDRENLTSTVVLVKSEVADRRPYRLRVRAERAAATRERILAAAQSLFMERWLDEISLRDIAARADVALQTVVRHFGTRDALMEALAKQVQQRAEQRRFTAPVGDIVGAVATVVELMEEAGPRVLRGLAQEDRVPGLRIELDRGRATHRRWVQTVFGPLLPKSSSTRSRRLAQLVAITDVYTWKLLRLDQGLSRAATELALVEMIERLLRPQEKQ
jgi:AcrR family transcriptional regulator